LDGPGNDLTSDALAVLEAVAALVAPRDDVSLLRVEVWPPERASEEASQVVGARLSRLVLGALVEAGLQPERLESVEHRQTVTEVGGTVRLMLIRSQPN